MEVVQVTGTTQNGGRPVNGWRMSRHDGEHTNSMITNNLEWPGLTKVNPLIAST
jgi:hypothetical protein